MQRRYEAKTRGERLIEHVAWNAAAGAALAVMILLLLGTLRWLDQIAPSGAGEVAPTATTLLARPLDGMGDRDDAGEAANRPTAVVAANRPSG